MCVISFIGDQWRQSPPTAVKPFIDTASSTSIITHPTRAEFEALKAEMEALRKLLTAAKIYDAETGQPDCEMEEKVALIKRLAELVGVDMSEVFGE
jgi:hypothetical protein